jgi:RNA polymerase sigma-70 factor (ECF subfamily)
MMPLPADTILECSHKQSVESIKGQPERQRTSSELPDPEALEDARLLRSAASGNQEALAAFYKRRSSLVYSLLFKMLSNDVEAQEATQDTFLKVWRRAGTYSVTQSSPSAWVVMLARGIAMDRLRSRARGSASRATYESEVAALETEVNESRKLERDELAEACTQALNSLPDAQSRALQLAFLKGWTHEEIAHATNEPLGTIKARIRRGLLSLRSVLKDYNA